MDNSEMSLIEKLQAVIFMCVMAILISIIVVLSKGRITEVVTIPAGSKIRFETYTYSRIPNSRLRFTDGHHEARYVSTKLYYLRKDLQEVIVAGEEHWSHNSSSLADLRRDNLIDKILQMRGRRFVELSNYKPPENWKQLTPSRQSEIQHRLAVQAEALTWITQDPKEAKLVKLEKPRSWILEKSNE